MMEPIYSQTGQLAGWLSGNVIYGTGASGVFFVRDSSVYDGGGYIGRLKFASSKLVLVM
jgi:hypothetical protein